MVLNSRLTQTGHQQFHMIGETPPARSIISIIPRRKKRFEKRAASVRPDCPQEHHSTHGNVTTQLDCIGVIQVRLAAVRQCLVV
jgi:hypothetical protein